MCVCDGEKERESMYVLAMEIVKKRERERERLCEGVILNKIVIL